MSSAQVPGNPLPSTLPKGDRGLRGAFAVAGLLLGIVAGLGLIAAAILWRLTGRADVGWMLLSRMSLLGTAVGAGCGLSRLICGGSKDPLLSRGLARGDLAALGGMLIAMILPASLAEHLLQAAGAQGQPQLSTGQAVEIVGPTLDGGGYDLAKHRGKVVLVDFWATWCGPCLAELPNVRAAFDKYHDDGFEVVAVSLDFKRESLDTFLEAHPEPWPQVFFDEEGKTGWENPLAKRYEIDGIPALMLVDAEGRLIARDLRGPQIGAAVAKALGKSESASFADWVTQFRQQLTGRMFYSVILSPWWMPVLCGLSGTIVLALVESTVRKSVLRRGVSEIPSENQPE